MLATGRCGWYLRVLETGTVPTAGALTARTPRRRRTHRRRRRSPRCSTTSAPTAPTSWRACWPRRRWPPGGASRSWPGAGCPRERHGHRRPARPGRAHPGRGPAPRRRHRLDRRARRAVDRAARRATCRSARPACSPTSGRRRSCSSPPSTPPPSASSPRWSAPAAEAPDGLARLVALYECWLDYSRRRVFPGGCFFFCTFAEFHARPGRVHDELADVRRRWLDAGAALVAAARDLGELGPGLRPRRSGVRARRPGHGRQPPRPALRRPDGVRPRLRRPCEPGCAPSPPRPHPALD